MFQAPLQQALELAYRSKLRLIESCDRTNQPWLLTILFPLLSFEATDFIQADARLFASNRSEEFTLDYVLAGEEQKAVAPSLTDVAAVILDTDVPSKWSTLINQQALLVGVLVEEQLRGEDLPGENQTAERSQDLRSLSISL